MGKGRKAPKKYSKMDYFEKQAFTKDQAERHGIELKKHTVNGRHEQVDWEASNDAVAKAISNDYDTRRSIEAAQLSGNKKAKDLGKGINNIVDAVNAERFMAKTHSKKLGATGKYSSANDEGNVTNYWVNKDRDKLMESFSEQSPADDEQTSEAITPTDYTESPETVKARETVQSWQDSNLGGGIHRGSSNQATSPGAGIFQKKGANVTTNVDDFAANYKKDVMSQLTPNIPI